MTPFGKYLCGAAVWLVPTWFVGGMLHGIVTRGNPTTNEVVILATYGVLTIVGMVIAGLIRVRSHTDRAIAVATEQSPSSVNPAKWQLDANSGEYYKIKRRHGGGTVTDSWGHGERMFHHYDRRRGLLRYAAISIGIFIPAVVVYLYLLNQDDFVGSIGRFLAFMFGGVSGATALCVSGRWLYLVLSKDRLVGPPPITPPQADDYGPQSATSQANAVIDELGYKPNA